MTLTLSVTPTNEATLSKDEDTAAELTAIKTAAGVTEDAAPASQNQKWSRRPRRETGVLLLPAAAKVTKNAV